MNPSFAILLALPLLAAPGPAAADSFPLAVAGCPMAHCDARMSDAVNGIVPALGTLTHIDSAAPGSKGGLGCVSNLRLVACSGAGDPTAGSKLIVYDAEGNRVWEDGGIIGSKGWQSAPIIGSDGSVIAADASWILRADTTSHRIVWQSHKPDSGVPISPVLAGTDNSMLLLATNTGDDGGPAELSVWDAGSGALLAHQPITDAATGKSYVTRNTPAVRGNRAYVLTAATGDDTDGRLYAVDLCNDSSCGARGAITLRWHYDFRGPSGASPLLIGQRLFFDGCSVLRANNCAGTFMAVTDTGAAPSLVWKKVFNARFIAGAAQDPRGGLWVYPALSDSLLRLNADSGATDQQVVVSSALGLAAGYNPASAVSVGSTAKGAVVLMLGTMVMGQPGQPTYVAAIDVSSTPAGTASWRFQVGPNSVTNASGGQFPVVVGATGARRIVFRGSNASTFFVGEP